MADYIVFLKHVHSGLLIQFGHSQYDRGTYHKAC